MKKKNNQKHNNSPEELSYEGAMVTPIFQTSNFSFESWEAISNAFDHRTKSFIYSRGNNPTVEVAQRKLADLARGERALLFGSGMGAISAAVLHCAQKDGHIIAIKNIYGPTNNLLYTYLKDKMNVSITFVSGVELGEFEAAIQANTNLIYLESPSSGIFSLQDIPTVAALAKKNDIKTVIDNTWATPFFQKPLEMGIDLEVHSCSKYIGGHSDVVAGVIIGSDKLIGGIFEKEYEWLGARIAPAEAALITRSIKTLPLRMKAHEANALQVATFLENHPKIVKVNYPGLESFEQYDLGKRQMSGNSGLLSFRLATNDLEKAKTFFNNLKKFRIAVSWGGYESLIYALAISYVKEMTREQFASTGLTYGDMRLSVGLENATELILDLEQALELI
ncbi:aminotransferase class I/II-fold pyridoxal phosphate-dependent enzyme [Flagellimonas hymeniacidonis]|uniref:Aminotransferase class I/II-fold pyridoxal phosphate-dependent enzyme n=1 Tax=Flagellimonas hymeniacidonis TaxID=2603628 RepID=A0A5C8V1C7_9FLAO|nr:aminotransferase class I/II-fold pyridoxal phosphate-dependent enzyme [Flagellimonas hymeniacidonis]TXN34949.1 aminotransferase class I/II-fold pyridoxal phosphate-dependent enzyme [Flagellimonas hymeniacidonis]